jgi:leucyl aminopeptidase
MQNVNLARINQVKEGSNLVYMVDMGSALEGLSLTKQETDYIQSEFEKENYQVFLNRYSYWIFIVSFDKTKKRTDVTEILRKAGNNVSQHITKSKADNVTLVDNCGDKTLILALAEGLVLGGYQFLKYYTDSSEKEWNLSKVSVVSSEIGNSDIQQLNTLLDAVYITRDLVNEPASYLTSELLAKEFTKLGNIAGFSTEILDKNKIAAFKMGGLLAVNQGSTQPPIFSVLTWKPANAVNQKPIVLVGKGIVYDSGGYSLKPTTDSMDFMKSDMAGAATVASVVYAVAKNKLPVYLIALVPSTDNRIGPDAYSPGDIITMSDGTTVEVLNTDAEGRLILADALVYAKKYSPGLVIDIATLTGAAHSAIGNAGMVGMGNAPGQTMQVLANAGEETYERIAMFPFWEEYKDQLKSDVADLKNVGGKLAGAITAGKFLEHFTDYPYIHLDIAGVAYFNKSDSYRSCGGTGIGVRLLYRFIENYINRSENIV